MIRKIIHIDEEKCNGCGACAAACHEGAIEMVNGKARLTRESFCDGFGDCLPNCPTGAITFETREAPDYDPEAVQAAQKAPAPEPAQHAQEGSKDPVSHPHPAGGCPGSRMRDLNRRLTDDVPAPAGAPVSRLAQWPVQIKLAPVRAPFYDGARLLVAADCTAYAYAGMHEEFMKGRVTLIGCPKLDQGDYTEKLREILSANDIRSLTVVRMEVPCCGGLRLAAENALRQSGRFIPWRVVTLSCDGRVLED